MSAGRSEMMSSSKSLASLVLTVWCAAAAVALETVRVEVSSGAPRLVIDGKPVRARMFWGGPGSRPLQIGPLGQQVTFEFTPLENEPGKGTMHLRFGHVAGTVDLDDIQVEDLDDPRQVIPCCRFEEGIADFRRDWTFWPTGADNTVGTVEVQPGVGKDGSAGLRVRLQPPAQGGWPDFHVYHHVNLALKKGHRHRVSLWVRAEPARALQIAFYRPGEPFTFLGGLPSCFERQIKLAAQAGVDFVSFPMPLPWPRPGQPVDWAAVDRRCRMVLDANPNALLLPRIGMGAPQWWRKAHPEAVMVWDRGTPKRINVVVASPVYRREAATRLRALVEHLEEQFGTHIAGYHPCGQNTGEWFYQETWGPALNGYSKASTDAWRRWLQQRYRSDSALRSAWHDPSATLEGAAVPKPEARRAAPAGVLRDPQGERALIDFAEFQQQMMAECVCHFARSVRQASAGRKLVVFFYGYVFEFGPVRNGPATSGHYALRRVLDCPDIDVLCSPISYFDRGLGGSGGAMTAAESVALAGKMWLYEDDTATYLSSGTFPGHRERVDTIEQSNALLVRNTAQCALRNFATWWMDLGSSGWFDDERMWAKMRQLRVLDEPLLVHPRAFRPEIAAVIDEQSMIRVTAGGDAATRPGVYEARGALARIGAPYGQYLLDDVTAGRVSAKLYVMLSAWCLSPQQRTQLLEMTRGSLRVWCYAPGYHDGDHTSLDAMQSLTGFRLQKVAPAKAWAEPTAGGKKLSFQKAFGTTRPIKPLFAATDAKAEETLAVYPDGSAAVALRRTKDGGSLFVGVPGLTAELLRLAARQAGVHLFTETDCNVYANGPYLVLHAAEDGPLHINTGHPGSIMDMMSGKKIGVGPDLSLVIRKGTTRVLELSKDK